MTNVWYCSRRATPCRWWKKSAFAIAHIIDKSMCGSDEPCNLKAFCSVFNEGASNLTLNRPDAIKLLAQIRRAPASDQIDVLKWIIQKFPKQAKEKLESLN